MAKRLGSEVFERLRPPLQQFNQKREPRLVATYYGCQWIPAGGEEDGNVGTRRGTLWLPYTIAEVDTDEVFKRMLTGIEYEVKDLGDIWVDRRGRVRATVLEMERVA